jgi:predicted nuclease with TOPRIM domain
VQEEARLEEESNRIHELNEIISDLKHQLQTQVAAKEALQSKLSNLEAELQNKSDHLKNHENANLTHEHDKQVTLLSIHYISTLIELTLP